MLHFKCVLLFLFIWLNVDAVVGYYQYANKRFITSKTPERPQTPIVNTRPIIGILSHEISQSLSACLAANNFGSGGSTPKSYISASYVKFIESAGARVVPIRIGEKYSYYRYMASSVNGILFPGGGAVFTASNGYADAAKILYNIALVENIPLWGTCLGFEIIVVLAAGADIRQKCNVNNVTKQLKFHTDYRKSKLFRNATLDVLNTLQTQSVTANTHSFCVTVKNMTQYNMTNDWSILTTTTENNKTFVSTIESKNHPVWGVQFHPEKNSFEWVKTHIVHSCNAVKAAQYFANFFVNEARRNSNRFATTKQEMQALIYNHKPVFTSKLGCKIEQCYLFY